MEDIDGGLHPAVDGQSLGERWFEHSSDLVKLKQTKGKRTMGLSFETSGSGCLTPWNKTFVLCVK